MTSPLFLAPDLALGGASGRIVLDGTEGHHAARVRRVRVGETVSVGDGSGAVASCVVSAIARDAVELTVVDVAVSPPPAPRLTVVQALPKGDRGELAVDMLTEVGVDSIVPWAASRCVTTWTGERGAKGLARWEAHAREAAKQARRAWLPAVLPLAVTVDVVALVSSASLAVVLHESAEMPLLSAVGDDVADILLVVGPEGGLTSEEVSLFAGAGAAVCRLGETVLRTSTAGVVAASVVLSQTRWA